MSTPAPLLEAVGIEKRYGPVRALVGVSLTVEHGKVACLLGDNGAGKSTLIKILSGAEHPDAGTVRMNGAEVRINSPVDALDLGIATVYQDLAVVPLMPVYRNFFVGREPKRGRGPFIQLDIKTAKRVTREALHDIGIDVTDVNRPIGTLSGGERQCVAIARAVHFGARVLILDEPTSALGVREAEIVLKYISQARERGVGVVLITHNAHHAYAVGDTFTIVQRGRVSETFEKRELAIGELVTHMAGGDELERLENGHSQIAGRR